MVHFTRFLIPISLIGLVMFGGSAVLAQTASTTCPDPQALQAQQEPAIVAAANQSRTAANLGPLTVNSLLQSASQRQSNDMAAHDVLSHTGSDGSNIGTRATDAGYNWTTLGENILQRTDMNAADAYNQWWTSPPHKANIMDPALLMWPLPLPVIRPVAITTTRWIWAPMPTPPRP